MAKREAEKAKSVNSTSNLETPEEIVDRLWGVESFEAKDGSFPFDEFVASLPKEVRNRFFHRLSIVQQQGLGTAGHILEPIEKNLWVIRLPQSDGNPRFFCCVIQRRTFWLLHGFEKRGKSNDKIPESEKIIARRRRQEWTDQLKVEQGEQVRSEGNVATSSKLNKGKKK